MNKNLLGKVFDFTAEKDLFSAPCHVLLGVSGGADSMTLLHMLCHWKTPLRVSAIHIHHGLRGESADRDAAFVCAYCDEHNIPLTLVHADVAAVAVKEHLTTEEAGRRVRYEQFEATRRAIDADYVMTAHTADDQTETVLMHLVRGCGIDGLAGIPVMRGNIRRPLLCCTRAEIEEYCALNGIPFVTDETNFETAYTRNVVRHRVLPLLREINPAVDHALLRLSRHAGEDADYLNEQAADALARARCDYGFYAEKIAAYPLAVRHRAIRLMLLDAALSAIEEAYILAADEVVLHRNGSVSLSDGYVFTVQQGIVSVRKAKDAGHPAQIMPVSVPCTVQFGDFCCRLSKYVANDQNVHKLFLQSAVDYDKIVGELYLRCRRTGDYLHPSGRGVGKSLKKLMNEWHIPAHLRDAYPLLCDETGVVLVPGYTCDERVKVTNATKHYLVCETNKVQG